MKTISMIANNRPEYFSNALDALHRTSISLQSFDKLILSLEPGCEENQKIAFEMQQFFHETNRIETIVLSNQEHAGVSQHPLNTLQYAFEHEGSDFHVALEDDACVTNDALILANWFWMSHGGPQSKYTLLSFCNHANFGRGVNPCKLSDDPALVVESPFITSPFAWALTKYQWPFVKTSWNCKKVPPIGWDWSLSYAMYRMDRKALHPILSRCQNIGRENGIHETPKTFDDTQTGLIYSSHASLSDLRIVGHLMPEGFRLKNGMRSLDVEDVGIVIFGETSNWQVPEIVSEQIFSEICQ